jgi:hypothetical protein
MAVAQRRCLRCLHRGTDGCYVMLEVIAFPLDFKDDAHFRRQEYECVAMELTEQEEVAGLCYTWSACLLDLMTRSRRSI